MKKKLKWFSIPVVIAMIMALILSASPTTVSVTGEGKLSLETHIALAVNKGVMGNGDPVPQQVVEATVSRSGPPVVSVIFNNPGDPEADALTIYWTELPTSHVKKSVMCGRKAGQGEAEAEREAEKEAEGQVRKQSLEVWTLLSDFLADDPVRNGVLQDNERIEKVKGKTYLVITLSYIDIHIFSQDPLRFTVKVNGLEAGPITGEWWK